MPSGDGAVRVLFHKLGVAGDVGCEYFSQPPLNLTFGHAPPQAQLAAAILKEFAEVVIWENS